MFPNILHGYFRGSKNSHFTALPFKRGHGGTYCGRLLLNITEASNEGVGNPEWVQSTARFSCSVSSWDRVWGGTALPLCLVGSVRTQPPRQFAESQHWHCPKTWGAAVFLRHRAEGTLLAPPSHFLLAPPASSSPGFDAKGRCVLLRSRELLGNKLWGRQALRFPPKKNFKKESERGGKSEP